MSHVTFQRHEVFDPEPPCVYAITKTRSSKTAPQFFWHGPPNLRPRKMLPCKCNSRKISQVGQFVVSHLWKLRHLVQFLTVEILLPQDCLKHMFVQRCEKGTTALVLACCVSNIMQPCNTSSCLRKWPKAPMALIEIMVRVALILLFRKGKIQFQRLASSLAYRRACWLKHQTG